MSRAVQGTDEVLFTMASPGFVMKGREPRQLLQTGSRCCQAGATTFRASSGTSRFWKVPDTPWQRSGSFQTLPGRSCKLRSRPVGVRREDHGSTMEGGIVYLLTLVLDFFACFLYRGGSCAGLLQASLLTPKGRRGPASEVLLDGETGVSQMIFLSRTL